MTPIDDQPTDPTQRIPAEGEEATRKLETDPTRVMPAGSVPPPGAPPSPPPVPPPVGSSGPGSSDGGPSTTMLVLGAVAAAIAGLVIGAVAIGGGDTKTVTLSQTETITQTGAPPPTTTPPTTTTDTNTTPSGDVTVEEAQAAAQTATSETAFKAGISLAPGDIEAKCTSEGGATTSNSWSCEVSNQSGQCTGTLTVAASGEDTKIEDNQVVCKE